MLLTRKAVSFYHSFLVRSFYVFSRNKKNRRKLSPEPSMLYVIIVFAVSFLFLRYLRTHSTFCRLLHKPSALHLADGRFLMCIVMWRRYFECRTRETASVHLVRAREIAVIGGRLMDHVESTSIFARNHFRWPPTTFSNA